MGSVWVADLVRLEPGRMTRNTKENQDVYAYKGGQLLLGQKKSGATALWL